MTRYALACGLLVIALGCKGRPDPPHPSDTVAETPPADRPDAVDQPPESQTAEVPAAEAPSEPTEAPELPPPPPRDLAAELREAVGSPADCMKDYRPASATTVQIRIRAVVRPTGMVIEPSASGAGLSMNDRRCIEERVGAVLLEPLGGTSSETVTTYVAIRYEPPTVEEYDVAPPPPPPDDVVQALPKKEPIAPSGVPIEGPKADPIEGPDGVPIDGPGAVPIEGPEGIPIGSE